MKTLLPIVLFIFLPLFSLNSVANNIQLNNTKLTGQNTIDKFVMVQFDLSWENSWRTSSAPNNWDAAWVFVKYRITTTNGGDDLWKHAWLNNSGHSSGTGTGASIDAGLLYPGEAFNANTNPGLGVFIYRSTNGTGTFSSNNLKLRWNYGANGVADDATVDVQVFAVEMVYVPQGAFAAGSGGSEASAFTITTISTENAITSPSGTGSLGGQAGGFPTGQTAPANASWPNGYNGFYIQKYEITQQQYVDFLNTLTYTQQDNRVNGSPNAIAGTFTNNANRHKIKIQTSGTNPGTPAVYATEHPYLACNYLSWMDGAAYADWAALRPMTELEFEKACRGIATPVANEYAWGTSLVAGSTYTLNNVGAANEGIAVNYSTAINTGNASYSITDGAIDGPLRVGIFAAHASNTGRITAGASYYGVMELSGNLWERAVTMGNATGLAFTGLHGNGTLSTAGHANETFWPGLNNNEVTDATGSGFRGGMWYFIATYMRISDRGFATFTGADRIQDYGFRAVRNIP